VIKLNTRRPKYFTDANLRILTSEGKKNPTTKLINPFFTWSVEVVLYGFRHCKFFLTNNYVQILNFSLG
jgi:hypothetical protein